MDDPGTLSKGNSGSLLKPGDKDMSGESDDAAKAKEDLGNQSEINVVKMDDKSKLHDTDSMENKNDKSLTLVDDSYSSGSDSGANKEGRQPATMESNRKSDLSNVCLVADSESQEETESKDERQLATTDSSRESDQSEASFVADSNSQEDTECKEANSGNKETGKPDLYTTYERCHFDDKSAGNITDTTGGQEGSVSLSTDQQEIDETEQSDTALHVIIGIEEDKVREHLMCSKDEEYLQDDASESNDAKQQMASKTNKSTIVKESPILKDNCEKSTKITKIPSVVVTNENNDIIEEMNESQSDVSQAVRRQLKSKILEKRERRDLVIVKPSEEPVEGNYLETLKDICSTDNQEQGVEQDDSSFIQSDVQHGTGKEASEQVNASKNFTETKDLEVEKMMQTKDRETDQNSKVTECDKSDERMFADKSNDTCDVSDNAGLDNSNVNRNEESNHNIKNVSESENISEEECIVNQASVCDTKLNTETKGADSNVDNMTISNDSERDLGSIAELSKSKIDSDNCDESATVSSVKDLSSNLSEDSKITMIDLQSKTVVESQEVGEKSETNVKSPGVQSGNESESNDLKVDQNTSNPVHVENSSTGITEGSKLGKDEIKTESVKLDSGRSDKDNKEVESDDESANLKDYNQFKINKPPLNKTVNEQPMVTSSIQTKAPSTGVSLSIPMWQAMTQAYTVRMPVPQSQPRMGNLDIRQMNVPIPNISHQAVRGGIPPNQQVLLTASRQNVPTLVTGAISQNQPIIVQRVVQNPEQTRMVQLAPHVDQSVGHFVPTYPSPQFHLIPISQAPVRFTPVSIADTIGGKSHIVSVHQMIPSRSVSKPPSATVTAGTIAKTSVSTVPSKAVSVLGVKPTEEALGCTKSCSKTSDDETEMVPSEDESQLLNQFSFYRCDRCAFQTRLRQNFRRHYSLHLNYKPYSCNTCSFKSYNKYGMPTHVNQHEQDARKGFQYFPDPALDKTIEFFCDKCKEVHWVDNEAYAKLSKEILSAQKSFRFSNKHKSCVGKRSVGDESTVQRMDKETVRQTKYGDSGLNKKLPYTGKKRGPKKKIHGKPSGDVTIETKDIIRKRPYRRSLRGNNDALLDLDQQTDEDQLENLKSESKKKRGSSAEGMKLENASKEDVKSVSLNKKDCIGKKRGPYKKQEIDDKGLAIRKVKKSWKFGMHRMKVRRRLALAKKKGNIPNYEIVDESNILSTPKRVRKFKTTFDPSPEIHRKSAMLISNFKSQSSLKILSKGQEVKQVRKVKCPYCQYYSDSVIGVRRHAFWSHNMCQYHCARCTFSSLSKRDVLDHNKEKHSGQSPCISRSLSKVMANGESFESIVEEVVVEDDESIDRGVETPSKVSVNKSKSETQVPKLLGKGKSKSVFCIPLASKSQLQRKKWKRSIFKCTECGYMSTYQGLQRHMMLTHQICQYQCGHCDFYARDREVTITHSLNKHKGVDQKVIRSYVNLDIPQENIVSESSKIDSKALIKKKSSQKDRMLNYKLLKKYKNKVTNLVSCPLCDFQSQYRGVQRHLLMLHKVFRWQCGHCNLQTTDKSKAMEHSLSEHDQSPWIIRSFVNLDKVMDIVRQTNYDIPGMTKFSRGSGRSTSCDPSANSSSLPQGSVSESSEKESLAKDTKCPECEFQSNVRGVQRHMLLVHKICRWQCKQCGFESLDKRVTLEHTNDMHKGGQSHLVRAFVDLDKYIIVKRMNDTSSVGTLDNVEEKRNKVIDLKSKGDKSYLTPSPKKKRKLISLTPSKTDDEDESWGDISGNSDLYSLKKKKSSESVGLDEGKNMFSLSSSKAVDSSTLLHNSKSLKKNRFRSSSPPQDILGSTLEYQMTNSSSELLQSGKKKRGRPKGMLNLTKTGSTCNTDASSSFVLRPKDLYLLNQGFSCVYCVYAAPLRHQVRLHCYDKHTNHPACLMEFKIDADSKLCRGDVVDEYAAESPEHLEQSESNKENKVKTEEQDEDRGDLTQDSSTESDSGGMTGIKSYFQAGKVPGNHKDMTDCVDSSSKDRETSEQLKSAIDCKLVVKSESVKQSEIQNKDVIDNVQLIDLQEHQNSQESDIDELQVSEIIENGKRYKKRRKRKLRFRNPLKRLVNQLKSGRIDLTDTFHGSLDDVDSFLHKFGVRTLNMDMLTQQQFSTFIKKFGNNLQPV